MRFVLAALGVEVLLLVCAGSASASWSTPRSFSSSGSIGGEAVAVDSRGEAAVAWSRQPPPPGFSFGTAIRVAIRLPDGRLIRRVVWSSRADRPAGVSVVIGHGQVTVAWAVETPKQQRRGRGEATVWSAFGPLIGRWAPPRVIGRQALSIAPVGRSLHLAISPFGEVLLAFDDGSPAINGPAAAWRAPGRPFAAPRRLFGRTNVALTVPHQFGPIPEFDPQGRAYVWGRCDGVVVSTAPRSHTFGRPVILARRPVSSFTLSLAGPGRGLAAWIRGGCAVAMEEGNKPGPLLASVLRGGSFSSPVAVTGPSTLAVGSVALAQRAGGGTVTWVQEDAPPVPARNVHIGTNGRPGPILPAPVSYDVLVPGAYDGGGDTVLVPAAEWDLPGAEQSPEADAAAVAPAGGGSQQLAPVSVQAGGRTGVASFGRRVVRLWSNSPSTLAVSVWRP